MDQQENINCFNGKKFSELNRIDIKDYAKSNLKAFKCSSISYNPNNELLNEKIKILLHDEIRKMSEFDSFTISKICQQQKNSCIDQNSQISNLNYVNKMNLKDETVNMQNSILEESEQTGMPLPSSIKKIKNH